MKTTFHSKYTPVRFEWIQFLIKKNKKGGIIIVQKYIISGLVYIILRNSHDEK